MGKVSFLSKFEETLECDEDGELCRTYGVLNTIGKKWTICLVSILRSEEGYRFNELQRKLNGISPKTLSNRLKELQEANLVDRKVKPESPPKVEYKLTEEGESLKESLYPLVEWLTNRKNDINFCESLREG